MAALDGAQEEFVNWLTTEANEEMSMRPRNPSSCPLSCFLTKKKEYVDAHVTAGIYFDLGPGILNYASSDTPQWASNFIRYIDSYYGPSKGFLNYCREVASDVLS